MAELVVGRARPRRRPRVLLDHSAPGAAPSVRERLLDEAAGNPLALLELPVALSDAQLEGRAPLPGALPLTARLRASFSERVDRLPEATREALLIAAAEEAGELAVTLRAARRARAAPGCARSRRGGRTGPDRRGDPELPPSARALGRLRVGDAGPAPANPRRAGRRAGGRGQRGARRLAPRDSGADARTRRSRARSRHRRSAPRCGAVTHPRRAPSNAPRRSARRRPSAPGGSLPRRKPPGPPDRWTAPRS